MIKRIFLIPLRHMKRQKTLMWMVAGAVFVLAVTVFVVRAVRRDGMMHAALAELQAANQAGVVFGSDSAAQALVNYFDYPWHRSNNRVLAYYLLGRAHADMGEAPQAIEAYQTAIERADTTAKDCDLFVLSAVYGQMAEVFHEQNLPEDEIEAQKMYNHLSWVNGDTLYAICGYNALVRPYFLLSDTANMLRVSQEAKAMFIQYGYRDLAALANIGTIDIYIGQQNYELAKESIEEIRRECDIFDEQGNLRPGREMFYYTLGLFFDGINQLDSAEYYYRRVLATGESEAGYKGLLSVYGKLGIADSIAKFAPLYADANDAMHRKMNSDMVHQTASLYNYNRHLRQSRHFEQKANRIMTVTVVVLCLLLIALLLFYLHYKHSQRIIQEKENRLLNLHLQYISVNDSLRNALQKTKVQEQELSSFKEHIEDLSQQKEQLEHLLLVSDDRYKTFHEHELVKKFRLMANPANKLYASAYEREQLISLFQTCFPAFTHSIQDMNVKDKEWMVIVLTELGFQTGEMLMAARMDGNSVTMIKRSLSKKLFHQEGLATFHINLQTAIVTGRLTF